MRTYWETAEAEQIGIIQVSVASLRALPVFQSEMTSQLLLGTIVPIFEERNEFYYVQNWDGYEGWVNRHFVQLVDRSAALEWTSAPRLFVTTPWGVVRTQPDDESAILTDVVACNILRIQERRGGFTRVKLPDGRGGWLANDHYVLEQELKTIRPQVSAVLATAERFLGIPYLWGGVSPKGFDCSGFVQTVFRLNNMELPRDAGQKASLGKDVALDDSFRRLRPGDLLFFGKTSRRINHVAIYLGKGRYIHARGRVMVNSLLSDDPCFEGYLRSLLFKASRILP